LANLKQLPWADKEPRVITQARTGAEARLETSDNLLHQAVDDLSKKEGKTYRLPAKAEWEYACRAGKQTRYCNGDDPEGLADVGNVADAAAKGKFWNVQGFISADDGYVFAAPVGKFKPNAWGLYDMHGNVWEWCEDSYGARYYGESKIDDPDGPSTGTSRVLRGGLLVRLADLLSLGVPLWGHPGQPWRQHGFPCFQDSVIICPFGGLTLCSLVLYRLAATP